MVGNNKIIALNITAVYSRDILGPSYDSTLYLSGRNKRMPHYQAQSKL